MATMNHPGVFIEESLLTPNVTSTALPPPQALAGEHPRGPLEWRRVSSWTEFVRLYGGFAEDDSDLAIAAFHYFQRGSNLYVGRIAGANAAAATDTLQDDAGTPADTLQIDALNPGTWGNAVGREVRESALDSDYFDLVIYYGGTTSPAVVETHPHLTMDPTDPRYAPSLVNDASGYVTLTDLGEGTNPAVAAAALLAGGTAGDAVDSDDKIEKVEQLDTVPEPVVLSLPGETDSTVLNSVIAYAESREDLFVLIDPPAASDVSAIETYAESLTASSYAALYYPRVWVKDPAAAVPNAERLVPPSGLIAGLVARTDLTHGVFRAPAGSVGRLQGVTRVERQLSATELGTLNSAHINAIKPQPGLGIAVYGARTLRRTLEADRYVPVRRTLITVKRGLKENLQFAVFENNDERLWRAIVTNCTQYLEGLWAAGGLRGTRSSDAFYVKCDEELNPEAEINAGRVNVEVGVALQRPAEFVVIKLTETAGTVSAVEI